jgi:hypothetical protein
MSSFTIRLKSEEGNVMIVAFILLVVLTLIGIFATRTAQIDLQTAYNEVPYKQNFYLAEGGVNREVAQLETAGVAGWESSRNLLGKNYTVKVDYLGAFVPRKKGFSAIYFSSYDYFVKATTEPTTTSGQVAVASRAYKIGPKAE